MLLSATFLHRSTKGKYEMIDRDGTKRGGKGRKRMGRRGELP